MWIKTKKGILVNPANVSSIFIKEEFRYGPDGGWTTYQVVFTDLTYERVGGSDFETKEEAEEYMREIEDQLMK